MATLKFKRKLTAILHADVKGYSRIMGEDEQATVRTLTAYREVMGILIQKHRGRVVRGSLQGYGVTTDKDGDKIFRTHKGKPVGKDHWKGTGKYVGIKGKGIWNSYSLAPKMYCLI